MREHLRAPGGPLSPGPSPTRGERGTATARDLTAATKRGRQAEIDWERWNVPRRLQGRMVEVARAFRKEPTPSERILWTAVRREQIDGRKFRRQQPIGPFVVDFYCPAERLIVEVDGGVHETQRERDAERQQLLETLDLRFLRLSAEQVEADLGAAVSAIRAAFRPAPDVAVGVPPSPLVGEGPGERGSPAQTSPARPEARR